MLGEHHYAIEVEWQGDLGTGTSGYRDYSRRHTVRAAGKLQELAGSSDRTFHGDRERWNPEELLLAALAQCHMLSYLHVATNHGVVVVGYRQWYCDRGGDYAGRNVWMRLDPIDPLMHRAAAPLSADDVISGHDEGGRPSRWRSRVRRP